MEETIRGEEPSVVIPVDTGRFLLQFNLLIQEDKTKTLKTSIVSKNGERLWTGTDLQAHGSYGTYVIACHSMFFPQGGYELIVEETRIADGAVLNLFNFPFRVIEPRTPVEDR